VDYAEKVGKRLPDEAEYEFAATNHGKTRFPWGDEPWKGEDWPLGDVKSAKHDCSRDGVYGLFSNVAEWTTSRNLPYRSPDRRPGTPPPPPAIQVRLFSSRVVRGAPLALIQGGEGAKAGGKEPPLDPRTRYGFLPESECPGLGFRCARSATPRFQE
jgi:formylglycine-generating enzyme required for sulfatase activity